MTASSRSQLPCWCSSFRFPSWLPPSSHRNLWPKLLISVLSFVFVGIYWVAHHNSFHSIQRSDRTLLWLNIQLLMCIVFIPFPQRSLVSTHSSGSPSSSMVACWSLLLWCSNFS